MKKFVALIILSCCFIGIYGQKKQIIIHGKVTDATLGEAIPFATIFFKNNPKTTQTDFDGFYTIKIDLESEDSIFCKYIGYGLRGKKIKPDNLNQNIDFQLYPEIKVLQEVIIKAGENPAYRIIRNAVANRSINDKRRLNAYEYDSYNRTEIAIDNISTKLKNKKFFKKIARYLDSLKIISENDGKTILPIFISESLSKFYYRDNLPKTKEVILATRTKGVAIDDGSLVSQIIGSSFQEYNFYKSYLNILNKDIPSPISENWRIYYDYFLADSMFIDTNWCYKIEVEPRNKSDLAFEGVVWITEGTWALKQVDLTIPKQANINFIDQIKIQQELEQTTAKAWLPKKQRIIIDIAEIGDSTAGMIAKFYTSNKNFIVQSPKENKFYDDPIEISGRINEDDERYWQIHRHDSLTQHEKLVFNVIDSLKKMPVIKTYVEIANIAINGYKRIGKLDFGPYLYSYAFNDIEGHRIQVGAKTNIAFSRKIVIKGYLAYGTLDANLKYSIGGKYIFNRKKWSDLQIEYKKDIEQLALNDDNKEGSNLFSAFARWITYRRPYWTEMLSAYYHKDIYGGLSTSFKTKLSNFYPQFPFAYYENPNNTQESTIKESFQNLEFMFEVRYARRELFLQNENERISLGTNRWPILTFRVYKGIKANGLNNYQISDFNYTRLMFSINQTYRISFLGQSQYNLTFNKYLDILPYPLLGIHLGNETFFFNQNSFNSMNFFEFISDNFIALNYSHYFEGFFLNKIPLIQKFKWREVINFNVLYGAVDEKNLNYLPLEFRTINNQPAYRSLDEIPYMEAAYGIENIFKFLRISVTHRLNYLNNGYKVSKFGIKLSAHFKI